MKKGRLGWFAAVLFIGISIGTVIGVVVDADQVYHTTIKKIRQNKSPDSTLVIDFDATGTEPKTKKEERAEKREGKKEERAQDRAIRRAERQNS